MNDMSSVIIPKSDQINADDLIAGPRTITIREVDIRPGTEQPVSIFYNGDNGKPWRPCKSMSRVLVAAWGPDAKTYVGRSVTLYRDPSVKWGGMEVGGIRVSHLSNIERDMVMALTATKGKRAPYTVKVLLAQQQTSTKTDAARKWADAYIGTLETLKSLEGVQAFERERATKLAELQDKRPELYLEVTEALARALGEFTPAHEPEGRSDEQHGDQHDGTDGPF